MRNEAPQLVGPPPFTMRGSCFAVFPEVWVAVIKPGRMLFEMEGVDGPSAQKALRLAAAKLSLPTQMRERRLGSLTAKAVVQ